MATSFIITAATVLSTLSNVSGSQSNSKYYYNADFQDGKVSQVNVLNKEGNYLSNKMSYRYQYDAQDRLVEKQTLVWDNNKHEWQQYQKQHYDYTDKQMVMTLSVWNKHTKSYEPAERYEYTLMMNNAVSLHKEKLGNHAKDMASAEHIVLLTPTNDLARTLQFFG